MSVFLVKATVRERNCDRNSPIVELQLDQSFNGCTIHPLVNLLELSEKSLLWVNIGPGINPVKVSVYWSDTYRRYIAKTEADTFLVNNLDKLPIVKPRLYQTTPGWTHYEVCPI